MNSACSIRVGARKNEWVLYMQPQKNWHRSGKLFPTYLGIGNGEVNLRAVPSGDTDPGRGALAQIAALCAKPGRIQAAI